MMTLIYVIGVICGVFLALVLGLVGFAAVFTRLPKFGGRPSPGKMLKYHGSPNFNGEVFGNLIATPRNTERLTGLETLKFLLKSKGRRAPKAPLPSVVSDPAAFADDALVWFGHSSFFLRLSGVNILVDPVFSRYASPFFFIASAFKGTNIYTAKQMPKIDLLLISHDHWDHLDYRTIMTLKNTVGQVICPLGVEIHFQRWGFPEAKVRQGDWWDSFEPFPGLKIHLVPSRHFGGRGLVWMRSLWTGFVIEAGKYRIYYSGDSGYGPHFSEIQKRFEGFDLALIECGQYDRRWENIHMTPEQSAKAAAEAGARVAMPVHCGKFSIAYHSWDDPFIRFSKAMVDSPVKPATPLIGEAIALKDPSQSSTGKPLSRWWEGLD
jgi:L-ascorbate metabolism protein UlaG (beta-lactamase superfamily)